MTNEPQSYNSNDVGMFVPGLLICGKTQTIKLLQVMHFADI